MKLSEMRQVLDARQIQLTKSLGQNFLHDAHQLDRILAQAELARSDSVLEIGPGLGPLTERLLIAAGRVLAIEKDARLVEFLCERFAEDIAAQPPRLRLIHDDAVGYLRDKVRDWSMWKLVANLPYSVASPILVDLALTPAGPERIVTTLQLEVARRLAAVPDSGDYGVLTLLVQLSYQPSGWFKVPPSCFFPEPDVDSACITLKRRAEPLLDPALKPAFVRLVKAAFSQRRKIMFKLLTPHWPVAAVSAAYEQLGLNPKARGEELSLGQFVELTRRLGS